MVRLPELRERLEDGEASSDDTIAIEVEELTRSVPKLIGVLADALRDRADVRHNAAVAEMISGTLSPSQHKKSTSKVAAMTGLVLP